MNIQKSFQPSDITASVRRGSYPHARIMDTRYMDVPTTDAHIHTERNFRFCHIRPHMSLPSKRHALRTETKNTGIARYVASTTRMKPVPKSSKIRTLPSSKPLATIGRLHGRMTLTVTGAPARDRAAARLRKGLIHMTNRKRRLNIGFPMPPASLQQSIVTAASAELREPRRSLSVNRLVMNTRWSNMRRRSPHVLSRATSTIGNAQGAMPSSPTAKDFIRFPKARACTKTSRTMCSRMTSIQAKHTEEMKTVTDTSA